MDAVPQPEVSIPRVQQLSLLVSGGDQAKQASLFSPNPRFKVLSLPVDKDANTTNAPFSLERPTLFRPTQRPDSAECRPSIHVVSYASGRLVSSCLYVR